MALHLFPQLSVPGASDPGTASPIAPRVNLIPTDETKKRMALAGAYKDSTIAVKYPATTAPAPTDNPEMQGMEVNLPPSQLTYKDPNVFKASLAARGYPEIFDNLQKGKADADEARTKADAAARMEMVNRTSTALGLIRSGMPVEGLQTFNQGTPKGQRATGIQMVDKDNFIIKTEDNPQGHAINAQQLDNTLLDAKTRLERVKPGFKTIEVNGQKFMYTEDQMGQPKHVATVAMGPFDTKAASDAAGAVGESNIALQKLATAQTGLNNATDAFSKHLDAGGGTGTRYAAGVVRGVGGDFDKAQALNVAIKKLNLDTLVSQFHGMTQAVNSDTERKAFEAAQYDISNQEPVLATQFVGGIKLSVAAQAEELAKKKYYEENKTTTDYVSPVIGKQAVMFTKSGEARLVPIEQQKAFERNGFMNGDTMAQKLLDKSNRIVPHIAGQSATTSAPVVVKTTTTKLGVVETLSDGTHRVKE